MVVVLIMPTMMIITPLSLQTETAMERTPVELLQILPCLDSLGAGIQNRVLVWRVLVSNPNSYHQAWTFGPFSSSRERRHMEAVCSSWVWGLAFASGRWKMFTCYLPQLTCIFFFCLLVCLPLTPTPQEKGTLKWKCIFVISWVSVVIWKYFILTFFFFFLDRDWKRPQNWKLPSMCWRPGSNLGCSQGKAAHCPSELLHYSCMKQGLIWSGDVWSHMFGTHQQLLTEQCLSIQLLHVSGHCFKALHMQFILSLIPTWWGGT